jgi:hypothetical protein
VQYCCILNNEGVGNKYTIKQDDYNFTVPSFTNFNPIEEEGSLNYSYIITSMRGKRYVCAE